MHPGSRTPAASLKRDSWRTCIRSVIFGWRRRRRKCPSPIGCRRSLLLRTGSNLCADGQGRILFHRQEHREHTAHAGWSRRATTRSRLLFHSQGRRETSSTQPSYLKGSRAGSGACASGEATGWRRRSVPSLCVSTSVLARAGVRARPVALHGRIARAPPARSGRKDFSRRPRGSARRASARRARNRPASTITRSGAGRPVRKHDPLREVLHRIDCWPCLPIASRGPSPSTRPTESPRRSARR